MGWLWGSGDSSSGQDQLDSSLRDFLKKEAPTGPKPSLPPAPKEKPTESPTQTQSQSQPQTQTDAQKPVVPPQSQFQDGRYADLWKNYTPQNIIDDRGKSEQDRLRDLVDAYNDRKASIGRGHQYCTRDSLRQIYSSQADTSTSLVANTRVPWKLPQKDARYRGSRGSVGRITAVDIKTIQIYGSWPSHTQCASERATEDIVRFTVRNCSWNTNRTSSA